MTVEACDWLTVLAAVVFVAVVLAAVVFGLPYAVVLVLRMSERKARRRCRHGGRTVLHVYHREWRLEGTGAGSGRLFKCELAKRRCPWCGRVDVGWVSEQVQDDPERVEAFWRFAREHEECAPGQWREF
jgi:hypothetical protein